jgi:hypothetical protein
MEIPYILDISLLIIIPLIIIISTYIYLLKKKDINLSHIDKILVSLIISSLLSICYLGFDFYILKINDFVAGCSGWCGIENAFFAIIAGGVGIISLLILIIKKRISKKNDINESNFTIIKKDLNIIYITSIIILVNLIFNLFSSNIFSIIIHEDFLGIIIELLRGPILQHLHLIILLSAVFFIKKSIFITKLLTYISLIFIILNYRYFLWYFSIIDFLFLIPIIILVFYIFKNVKSKSILEDK